MYLPTRIPLSMPFTNIEVSVVIIQIINLTLKELNYQNGYF